jgi:osmoprotectant transport system permease protein
MAFTKPPNPMNEHQQTLWEFMSGQSDKLLDQTLTHIGLTFISVLLAVAIGLPLGIWVSGKKRAAGIVLGLAGVLQTIPSIALLGFMIPLLGIGIVPAIAALFLYALLPIIRNTYTGITGVDPSVKDAAKGMGMSNGQLLLKVELPLAMPVIIAGIRTATVINVGVATLAAYIAAGGLGEFIFGGIALNNTNMILAGAIPAALLAIVFDQLLARLQRFKSGQRRVLPWLLPAVLIVFSSFYLLPSAGKGKLLAGFTPEFMGRQDGDLGLRSVYGLKMRTVVISDAVMYKAAHEGKLDVISGYSTDGRLKAFDLVSLKDDKLIFPPYYVAPLVRTATLVKYPELGSVLDMLSGKINDSVMTELNYRADYLHELPEKVAKDFLTAQGLYRLSRKGHKGTIRIGSKIFAEQYILAQMYMMLIEGYTDLDVAAKTGLGGTKICFDALDNDQIDMYPEYTGTGLLVILNTDQAKVNSLISNRDNVYSYVEKEFQSRYHVTWLRPVGFNNAYALMMRRKQAAALGISSISDLKRYIDK